MGPQKLEDELRTSLGSHELGDGQSLAFEVSGHVEVRVKIAETAEGQRKLIFELLGSKAPVPFERPDGLVFEAEDDGGAHFSLAKRCYSDSSPQVLIRPQPELGSYHIFADDQGKRIVAD